MKHKPILAAAAAMALAAQPLSASYPLCGRSSDGHSVWCHRYFFGGLVCNEYDSNNKVVQENVSVGHCDDNNFDNDGWDRNGNPR